MLYIRISKRMTFIEKKILYGDPATIGQWKRQEPHELNVGAQALYGILNAKRGA